MSKPCNREACALRLERLAASAAILSKELRTHVWYQDAAKASAQILDDAKYVAESVYNDKAWEAGDR